MNLLLTAESDLLDDVRVFTLEVFPDELLVWRVTPMIAVLNGELTDEDDLGTDLASAKVASALVELFGSPLASNSSVRPSAGSKSISRECGGRSVKDCPNVHLRVVRDVTGIVKLMTGRKHRPCKTSNGT